MRPQIRALPTLLASALAWTLAACGAPAETQADDEEVELGLLRLGRHCELGGVRYTLDARFDVTGPVELVVDTAFPNDTAGWELATGCYAIRIRPGFSLWRDVAVAQVQVSAELAADAWQVFEISRGASTLVAYEFLVDGKTATCDAD